MKPTTVAPPTIQRYNAGRVLFPGGISNPCMDKHPEGAFVSYLDHLAALSVVQQGQDLGGSEAKDSREIVSGSAREWWIIERGDSGKAYPYPPDLTDFMEPKPRLIHVREVLAPARVVAGEQPDKGGTNQHD